MVPESHCLHSAGMGASRAGPGEQDVQYMRQALAARGGPQVPHNFTPTAPGHDGVARRGRMPQSSPRSPQVCVSTPGSNPMWWTTSMDVHESQMAFAP